VENDTENDLHGHTDDDDSCTQTYINNGEFVKNYISVCHKTYSSQLLKIRCANFNQPNVSTRFFHDDDGNKFIEERYGTDCGGGDGGNRASSDSVLSLPELL